MSVCVRVMAVGKVEVFQGLCLYRQREYILHFKCIDKRLVIVVAFITLRCIQIQRVCRQTTSEKNLFSHGCVCSSR